MKKLWIAAFILSAWALHAQIFEKTAFNLGYRYIGRNVIQAGLDFRIGDSRYKSVILGPSVLYTRINHNDTFIPEAHIYYSNNGQLYGASINQYSIEPRIGISLFNIFFLNTGYAIPIHDDRYFKGVTFGIQFNIAPVKSSKFYDHMKMM
ncbi:hypothetical protein [Chryseobacterium indologenes]|uniref:hypothetical protein n=1 Tax=Chryseobacterium indologenes TaxID=253 RepID=UPI0016263E53|nr:hypothetical protein [Chryseobacterium indologenes]MBF6644225.1 hypothetical protein [Chryseobacterium indologenes]MBU3047719.1 hypothetical protein [Chryseobacterium indologenes]QQQ72062.1 hypothetical protein JHW31_04845 [Chryseobacterium indologenes]